MDFKEICQSVATLCLSVHAIMVTFKIYDISKRSIERKKELESIRQELNQLRKKL